MLINMYIMPLYVIIDSYAIIHHSFADNIQIQMSAPADKMPNMYLQYNKTKLMLVISPKNKHLHNLPTSITVGNVQILYYSIVIVVLCYYQYFIIFFCLSEYACLLSAAVIRHVIVPRPYLLSEEK